MKSGRQYSLRSALVHGLLFVLALYFLVPLYVMVVASFKSLDEIIHSSIIALPIVWTTAGWEKAWSSACTGLVCTGIRPYFFETMAILFPAMSAAIVIGALNGYLMSFWRSKERRYSIRGPDHWQLYSTTALSYTSCRHNAEARYFWQHLRTDSHSYCLWCTPDDDALSQLLCRASR